MVPRQAHSLEVPMRFMSEGDGSRPLTRNEDPGSWDTFIGWRKSRKDRRCIHCGHLIRKGEMYFRWDYLAWCTKDCAEAMAAANAEGSANLSGDLSKSIS